MCHRSTNSYLLGISVDQIVISTLIFDRDKQVSSSVLLSTNMPGFYSFRWSRPCPNCVIFDTGNMVNFIDDPTSSGLFGWIIDHIVMAFVWSSIATSGWVHFFLSVLTCFSSSHYIDDIRTVSSSMATIKWVHPSFFRQTYICSS